MSHDVKVRTLEPQAAMVCREQVAGGQEALPEVLGRLFGAVFGYVMANGGQPVSAPFTYYHMMTATGFDISCGCAVAEALPPGDSVEAMTLPGGEAAVTDHYGPYGTLREAHEAIEGWMAEQGRAATGGVWEIYWTDPGEEPDPAKWRTEVFWALR